MESVSEIFAAVAGWTMEIVRSEIFEVVASWTIEIVRSEIFAAVAGGLILLAAQRIFARVRESRGGYTGIWEDQILDGAGQIIKRDRLDLRQTGDEASG
jgi:hypothetical protein